LSFEYELSRTRGGNDLTAILRNAVKAGASDVHLHGGARLMLRVGGELRTVVDKKLSATNVEEALLALLTEEERGTLERHGQVDVGITVAGLGRFRANLYRQQRGLDAVFRVLKSRAPKLADLNLPAHLERLADFRNGLVLAAGPAGSGKSSTLAALVDVINNRREGHILTIEDPVELIHGCKKSVVNQRQVGKHTDSFARALRAALREDPDIILIGELRDLASISLAVYAAETGHLVLSTLHTRNAVESIHRLVHVFPPQEQAQVRAKVAEALRAVICQRLVRRADGQGRIPLVEILIGNQAVRSLIRDNKEYMIPSVMQTGESDGMCVFHQSLSRLEQHGVVERAEALQHFHGQELTRD